VIFLLPICLWSPDLIQAIHTAILSNCWLTAQDDLLQQMAAQTYESLCNHTQNSCLSLRDEGIKNKIINGCLPSISQSQQDRIFLYMVSPERQHLWGTSHMHHLWVKWGIIKLNRTKSHCTQFCDLYWWFIECVPHLLLM